MSLQKATHLVKGSNENVKDANTPKQPASVQFDNLVKLFWANNPYIKDAKKNNELEVRFGSTREAKPLTKIDYDNVIRKLKSLGFKSENEKGTYLLRINNEFLDSATGRFKTSQIRTEITGFTTIQQFCKNNDLKKLLMEYQHRSQIEFYKKSPYSSGTEKEKTRVFPVNMFDFNFRLSYQIEEKIAVNAGPIRNMLDSWDKSKKYFRYINRVTFKHAWLPINVDLSIVKSSKFNHETKKVELAFTTDEAGVFSNPESYEIELEVVNSEIGPATVIATAADLISSMRKTIKYVLMGLQGTNYPISYSEQKDVLMNYMKLIMAEEYDEKKHARVYSSSFIGPSSYTLQMANIAPVNERSNIPNIRNNYTVTEKADGQRFMMFISSNGKIYFINNSMNVVFTGAVTKNKEIYNTLIDGESVLHDKHGKFINLYAAFDIYFINKRDVRSLGFVPRKTEDNPSDFRLILLKTVIRKLSAESVVDDDVSPVRFECKKFYPTSPTEDIFSACSNILEKEADGLFEYNTDGLIFTPASMGVGADQIGKVGSLHKTITWDYSFKWKPAKYNTIDFLVKTIKNANSVDVVTPIFQDGIQTTTITQLNEYKTVILCVGFDPSKHGYINPSQDVLDDKLPSFKDLDNEKDYRPAEFVPTNPADPNAGICNIMLRKDDTGVNQMFTEEGEVFEDGTIVEFRYDTEKDGKWRWIPLRFRADKTARYKQGLSEFGNAYHVANSNWQSIHNPITEEMISTGNNIPNELEDDDVYYNRVVSASDHTRGLRDFHNLFVKRLLITGVSRRGDTLIDYACGKGGDFPKWIAANLSFVFGIDISSDNIENRIDGACARFLNYRKDFKHVPYSLFVNGNSSANIRSGQAMLNDKAIQITKAVFGEGSRDQAEDRLGKAVARQFGKATEGFNVSSCQFALHYFFENQTTFVNFMRNVSECTKVGGYFVGSCYDGKLIYNLLKSKKEGESIQIYENDIKIWELRKEYGLDYFEDDVTSIGYKISVYQQSINKMFPEYLVNFDYLNRIMENFGFIMATREEAKNMGFPEGSGLFSELFNLLLDDSKKKKSVKSQYGSALSMTSYEKKISFLNRYFVYKKIRTVNAEKIALDQLDETQEQYAMENRASKQAVSVAKAEIKATKPKVRKLSSKLVLVAATDAVDEDAPIAIDKPAKKERKPRAKKVALVIEDKPAEINAIDINEKPEEVQEQPQAPILENVALQIDEPTIAVNPSAPPLTEATKKKIVRKPKLKLKIDE